MPDFRRGEAVEPVSRAAVRAVRDPGVEVSASELGGRPGGRGRRGVWAVLLRRRQEPMPEQDHHSGEAGEAGEAGDTGPAGGEAQATSAAEDSAVSAT
jgi:hypothetical protein